MKFIGQSAEAQQNIITDGQLEVAYEEFPDLFARLNQLFVDKCISNKDTLVFQCDNSVPSAFILLYLFEFDYHFLLVPKTYHADLPSFCRYKITCHDFNMTGKLSDLDFNELLEVVTLPNPHPRQLSPSPQFYLRTSGSTGLPKMAVHRHAQFRQNALNCVERLGLTSTDRVAIPVPLFHMYGLGAGFMPSVAVQASIDLQKGANILRYLGRERAFNPNVAFLTPIFCETLLKGRRSARPYRLTVSAGDRFRGDTFQKYETMFGCLVNLYGSTEMGAMAAASPETPLEVRAQTVGYPMSGVQFRLETVDEGVDGRQQTVDASTPSTVCCLPSTLFGQLWCRHEAGCEQYVADDGRSVVWNSAETDGWFHTKDLGRINPDGSIQVIGRGDHSVNRDGLLVFFADIEKAIESLDTVEMTVVVSQGESQRGKNLTLYCVPVKDTTLTVADIRQACFDRLPQRAIPDDIFVVDSLPMLPSGKIDRQRVS